MKIGINKLTLLITSFIILLASFVAPLLVVTQPAYALDVINPICQNSDPNNLPTVCKDNTPTGNPIFGAKGIVGRGLSIFALIIGIIAVVVIIISGLRFVLSGGDSNSVADARRAIIYALIGLAIAATSQAIVSFILSKVQ